MAKKKKEEPESIVAYKGFSKDLTCRDFQFAIGETYEHDGEVEACSSGFHACTHPLDVFGCYEPANSRYARVELSGQTSTHDSDTKIAAAKIKITAEIDTSKMVAAAVEYVFSAAKWLKSKHVSKDYGAASSTGYQGAASSTGDYGAAMACGYCGRVMGAEGNALFLVERNDDGEIIHAWAGIAGRDGIEPNVFYTLKNGQPEQVK